MMNMFSDKKWARFQVFFRDSLFSPSFALFINQKTFSDNWKLNFFSRLLSAKLCAWEYAGWIRAVFIWGFADCAIILWYFPDDFGCKKKWIFSIFPRNNFNRPVSTWLSNSPEMWKKSSTLTFHQTRFAKKISISSTLTWEGHESIKSDVHFITWLSYHPEMCD